MARGWSYPYIRVTARWPNRKCPRSGGLPSLRSHRAPAYVIGMTNCPRCGKGMEEGFLGAKNRSFRHPMVPIEELFRPPWDADRRQRSPDGAGWPRPDVRIAASSSHRIENLK